MGQAAVDLPDPLEPPPVSSASTDDLLAQLAGEEIDRLLADDDGARTPKAAPPHDAIAPVATASPEATTPNPPAPPATTEAQLNDIFAQLDAGTLNATKATAPDLAAPVTAEAIKGPAPAAATELLEDDATRAAERGALGAAEMPLAAAPLVSAPADGSTGLYADEPSASDPMYVRVLEAMNAPLAACSDETRAALGKVAIVTAINAVAVLIYVLFFRRH